MPFDWKPSKPTKAIGGGDIYRPTRGNYALISAQCRNGASIEVRTYDAAGTQLSRQNWLTSSRPINSVHRRVQYLVRTSSHGSQPDRHGWGGSYTPRKDYIFEGFIYNLHNSYNLYYSFENLSFDASVNSFQYRIDNKSGSTREFVAPQSRVWIKLGAGKSLSLRSLPNPQGLSSSQVQAIEKSQGMIGYEHLATQRPSMNGWTFIDDHTELRAASRSYQDWSASVVEYGRP